MTLSIRRAKATDLPVILALLEGSGMYTTSVTLAGDVTYLLAESGGEVIGVLGLEHGQGASLLRSFTLRPDMRGRGWSSALLDHAYALLRERGDQLVYLFSADGGEFWRHQGYRPVPPHELAAALPETPQVRSAVEVGWLTDSLAWRWSLS